MQLSVVIASFQDQLGLYLTTFGVLQQLEHWPSEEWEIIIAADGGTEYKFEKLPNTRVLRINTGSPQGTRDAGIRVAKHANVLVLESHVIVSDIRAWLAAHIAHHATMSFPLRRGEGPEMYDIHGCHSKKAGNLWYDRLIYSSVSEYPFKIAQFGHSAFILDKNFYVRHGGYTDLLRGWGMEEQMLCLRIWLLGGECWFIPSVWQAHALSVGAHADAMASEDFARNISIVRYVIAGWKDGGLNITPEIQAERRRVEQGPFQGNIERLWDYFKREGVMV